MVERIKVLVKHTGLRYSSFALKCGLRQNTFSTQLSQTRPLNLETVMGIIINFPEVSAEWLLRGEGDMLKSTNIIHSNADREISLLSTITTMQDIISEKSNIINKLSDEVRRLREGNNNKFRI